jgi:ferredoxin
MEAQDFPDKCWVISHKPVAVAAGLGHMGIHRNVIHPKFGNFILLGTILMDAEVAQYNRPIDYNPCVECKLCVSACPVGAIGAKGSFNFSACYTHNYREFLGGFGDWAKNVAESNSARDYERKVGESDSSALWQSLSFGASLLSGCLSGRGRCDGSLFAEPQNLYSGRGKTPSG